MSNKSRKRPTLRMILVPATSIGTILSALVLSEPFTAQATLRPISESGACYRFRTTDVPLNAPNRQLTEEVWCYEPVREMPGATFIYNADEKTVKAELAAIVSEDGYITHASLLSGELTVHRVKESQFNPLPVPTLPPQGSPKVPTAEVRDLQASAAEVLQFLLSSPSSTEDISVQEGQVKELASSAALPWRGYWWPYSSMRLSAGNSSPLAKYDTYVRERIGRSGAQTWEKVYHKYEGVKWSGHCNGWAASSILRREPRASRRDSVTGIVFTVSDQKGLLAEKDMCVKNAFFGRRYNGKPGDDLKDIYPAKFHQTLSYYIGRLNKPVIMDRFQGASVDNHVVSGYTMNVKRTGPDSYDVATKLTVHGYDKEPINTPGNAPSYQRTFQYTLREDAGGNIIGGEWKSTNPDFLWVPLSPGNCDSTNYYITEEWITQIMGW